MEMCRQPHAISQGNPAQDIASGCAGCTERGAELIALEKNLISLIVKQSMTHEPIALLQWLAEGDSCCIQPRRSLSNTLASVHVQRTVRGSPSKEINLDDEEEHRVPRTKAFTSNPKSIPHDSSSPLQTTGCRDGLASLRDSASSCSAFFLILSAVFALRMSVARSRANSSRSFSAV
jgi:hypothetical protein